MKVCPIDLWWILSVDESVTCIVGYWVQYA
jgi:hypothetical protein